MRQINPSIVHEVVLRYLGGKVYLFIYLFTYLFKSIVIQEHHHLENVCLAIFHSSAVKCSLF